VTGAKAGVEEAPLVLVGDALLCVSSVLDSIKPLTCHSPNILVRQQLIAGSIFGSDSSDGDG
jgi:hypothetical protein